MKELNELTAANRENDGFNLPYKDTGTGFQASPSGHGVDLSGQAANRLGGLSDTDSDSPEQRFNRDDANARFNAGATNGGSGTDFTGSFGRLSASSDAPGEENVNDADAGDRD